MAFGTSSCKLSLNSSRLTDWSHFSFIHNDRGQYIPKWVSLCSPRNYPRDASLLTLLSFPTQARKLTVADQYERLTSASCFEIHC
jgi:hypothetical protein